MLKFVYVLFRGYLHNNQKQIHYFSFILKTQKDSAMKFKTPTSFAVIGGTMSGKTHFVWNLLKSGSEMFDVAPSKIIYCYMEEQPIVDDMKSSLSDFDTYKGLPSREEIKEWSEDSPHTVIILDDMIHLVTKSSDALYLFQTMVSHSKVTAFLLSQNLYPPGVYAKSILLNCQHVILFKNVRDNRQIITFGSQVFTGRSKFWMDAYAKAVSHPYGYILIDLTNHCPEERQISYKYLTRRRRDDIVPT